VGTVADLVAEREHVLFTFDGPVCSVFPYGSDVADRLRMYLGHGLPPAVATTTDPFRVLSWARAHSDTAGRLIELELRKHELTAVGSAVETPGVLDLVHTLALWGHTVTVVSNTSSDAVTAYLAGHEVGRYVREVSARHSVELTPLTPHPYLLLQALGLLDTTTDRTCLIAAGPADLQAAAAIGMPAVEWPVALVA
jgi:beta-phosphoglucomutase-like phosphatase (HAD superfamily)